MSLHFDEQGRAVFLSNGAIRLGGSRVPDSRGNLTGAMPIAQGKVIQTGIDRSCGVNGIGGFTFAGEVDDPSVREADPQGTGAAPDCPCGYRFVAAGRSSSDGTATAAGLARRNVGISFRGKFGFTGNDGRCRTIAARALP